jgi:hypothetical protein
MDAVSESNSITIDSDDFSVEGGSWWDVRDAIRREGSIQAYMGWKGKTISFPAASVGDASLKNNQLLDTWEKTGKILQFMSTYHNYSHMVTIQEYARTTPIDFPADNYYEYTLKLLEFYPLELKWENPATTNSLADAKKKATSTATQLKNNTKGIVGPGGTDPALGTSLINNDAGVVLAQTGWDETVTASITGEAAPTNIGLIAATAAFPDLGRAVESYRAWVAGSSDIPTKLEEMMRDTGVTSLVTQRYENGYAVATLNGSFDLGLINKYAQAPWYLTINNSNTITGTFPAPAIGNSSSATWAGRLAWFPMKSAIATDNTWPSGGGTGMVANTGGIVY